MVPLPLDPPVNVSAGTKYAIVLLAVGLPCLDGYGWQQADGSTYPAGEAFSWLGFSGWGRLPSDYMFNTYVDTALTVVNVSGADRVSSSTVRATVLVTCDPQPLGTSYVVLFLTLFQGNPIHGKNYREGQGGVGLEGINGIICDGTPHAYTFPVTLTSFFTDKRFTPGPAGFEWFLASCVAGVSCTTLGGPTQGEIKIRP
jgi:hypothetical protein